MNKEVNQLDRYIKSLASKSGCTMSQIEEIVLTQVAISLGDLGVKNNTNIFLGKIELKENGSFILHPNDFIRKIVKGEVDPLYLLNEFLKKT